MLNLIIIIKYLSVTILLLLQQFGRNLEVTHRIGPSWAPVI